MTEQTPLSVHEPSGDAKGGIVVIQEAFGVNDHIEDVCRRLASEDWLAVAPHLFHRTGDPKLGYEDFSQVMPYMAALKSDEILTDIDAALDRLGDAGIAPAKRGAVGFCMGGTCALVTAVERPIGAAVTFYGGGVAEGRFGFPSLIELAPRLGAAWLGLYADKDRSISVDQVERLRAAAAESGQPTEVVRYPDAEHGFNCDQRGSYHAASAQDAWLRMLDWFDRYLAF